MIITTFYGVRDDGVKLYQRKSDLGVKIREINTDKLYDDPIDVENTIFEYEETNIPIEDEEATVEDYENALERLGVQIE